MRLGVKSWLAFKCLVGTWETSNFRVNRQMYMKGSGSLKYKNSQRKTTKTTLQITVRHGSHNPAQTLPILPQDIDRSSVARRKYTADSGHENKLYQINKYCNRHSFSIHSLK